VTQRIGVAEAVRLFTYGSAYAAREERILGSIEPGKLADLVVLRQGLEDVAPTEIAGIDIDLVMVDGEVAVGR
jgi:predicted amidohydrolase YtcJ